MYPTTTAHFADLGTGAAIPVVGGTGAYSGASGTVVLVGGETATTATFDFTTK